MKIKEIKENKKQFLSLLLLADEQEDMIDHNDNSRTVNQTNNSPKALSRLEIYRLTRNAVNT